MMNYDEMDESLLTHMLGYLPSEKWVDALANYNFSEEQIKHLLLKQDRAYGGHMYEEVMTIRGSD